MTDIEIAKKAVLSDIGDIAKDIGIPGDALIR